MSNNECHFVTEILQIFSNLSKYICLICLDLRDFSPQATKYQRFRILRNLSMPFLLTKNHIDKRHHVSDIHSPIAVHIVTPLVKHDYHLRASMQSYCQLVVYNRTHCILSINQHLSQLTVVIRLENESVIKSIINIYLFINISEFFLSINQYLTLIVTRE